MTRALMNLLRALPANGTSLPRSELPSSAPIQAAYEAGLASILSAPGERGSYVALTPEGIRARRSLDRNIQGRENYGKAPQN